MVAERHSVSSPTVREGLSVKPALTPSATDTGFRFSSPVNFNCSKLLIILEAAIGIEPMNKAFAELCLTTWLRRRF